MLALPLLVYALFCAYRDREATRARRHRNPYSLADLLELNYQQALTAYRLLDHGSMGQMYSGARQHG